MTALASLRSSDAFVELATRDFRFFLARWHFVNRETGRLSRFVPAAYADLPCPIASARPDHRCADAHLWRGQEMLIDAMLSHPLLFALKAGKLGYSELECAYDGWRALCGPSRSRVHLLSRDGDAAKSILSWVKFGCLHLPPSWGVKIAEREPGAKTVRSLILRGGWMVPGDLRSIWSYASSGTVGIDQTAMHTHLDELSVIEDAETLYNTCVSTVAPGGSLHVVTRGAGPDKFSARLWHRAERNPQAIYPFFSPFDWRDGRGESERAATEDAMAGVGIDHYLPRTAEDALSASVTEAFVAPELWERCGSDALPPLLPGDRTPVVIAMDAGVSSDCFAVVIASRDPEHRDWPAIRACRVWVPAEQVGGRVNFDEVERWLRMLIEGGCRAGHAKSLPQEGCEACGTLDIPGMNVVQICYDMHQLEDMAQRLRRARLAWVENFPQTEERLIADSILRQRIYRGEIRWRRGPENAVLTEHINNARAKVGDQEDRLRIVKRADGAKVDAAVAASMAVKRVMGLNL